MHLSDLKSKPVTELVEIANTNEIDGANRMRKHDLIFALLKNQAKKGESIYGDGTLEVLPDGFGFLRSPDTSYLVGPGEVAGVRRAQEAEAVGQHFKRAVAVDALSLLRLVFQQRKNEVMLAHTVRAVDLVGISDLDQ